MEYRNNEVVSVMVCDRNPNTWNKPNLETKVNSKVDLNQGDLIILRNGNDGEVYMVINEIVDVKDSTLNGYKYYTLKTTRKKR